MAKRNNVADSTVDHIADNVHIVEDAPLSSQHIENTLVETTNLTDASSPFYYYWDMDGYRMFSIQLALDCDGGTVTATIEGSLEDNSTAPASCQYEDITNAFFGVANLVSAAAPATALWIVDTPVALKYCRLKIAAATGGNTGDVTAFLKKMW